MVFHSFIIAARNGRAVTVLVALLLTTGYPLAAESGPKKEKDSAVVELPAEIIYEHIDLSQAPPFDKPVHTQEETLAMRHSAFQLLKGGQYAKLDELLDKEAKAQSFNSRGQLTWHDLAYDLAKVRSDDAACRKWLEETGSTHAMTVVGIREIHLAWDARGNGWANTVSEEGWEGMRQHLRQAHGYLEQAIQKNPANVVAMDAMMTVGLGQRAEPKEMNRLYKAAQEVCPAYTEPYASLAYYLLPRWHGDAKTYATFLIANAPKILNTQGKFTALLGVAKYTKHWNDIDPMPNASVQRYLERLVAIFSGAWPQTVHYESKLAGQLILSDCWDPARKVIEEGLKKMPDAVDLHFLQGKLLVETDRDKEAIPILQKVVEEEPDDPEYHYWLANAYHYTKQYPKARANYEKAVKFYPPDETFKLARSHERLCYGYIIEDKFDLAVAHGRKAVELRPQNAKSHYFLGFALAHQGNKQEALVELKESIRLDPKLREVTAKDFPDWQSW